MPSFYFYKDVKLWSSRTRAPMPASPRDSTTLFGNTLDPTLLRAPGWSLGSPMASSPPRSPSKSTKATLTSPSLAGPEERASSISPPSPSRRSLARALKTPRPLPPMSSKPPLSISLRVASDATRPSATPTTGSGERAPAAASRAMGAA